MVVFKNKLFSKCDMFPNTDFIGNADFILNDNDEKDAEIEEKIISMYPNFDFVLNDDGTKIIDVVATEPDISILITQKKQELSAECKKQIVAGFTIGDDHYSLTLEDEINIASMRERAKNGQPVQYHADGKPCRIYTAEEFIPIANAAEAHITHHTTYNNLLMRQVEAMTNADEINDVQYGVTELTGEFMESYEMIMTPLAKNIDNSTNEIAI